MSNDIHDWYSKAAILLFAIIALMIGWDLVADYQESVNYGHMAIELCVMSVAASGTVLLWLELRRAQSDLARALYRKSGLSGRAELSAFFLEDLLLPRSA